MAKGKGFLRFMFMPIVRPLEQSRESMGALKEDFAKLRELRELREKQAQAELEEFKALYAKGDVLAHSDLTPEDLENPKRIKNPHLRFEAIYAIRGWSPESLKNQLISVRRTKIASAYLSIFTLLGALFCLFWLPVVAMIFACPMLLFTSSVSLASAVKYGMFQSQIEQRKLLGHREFLGRPDLFRYLVR